MTIEQRYSNLNLGQNTRGERTREEHSSDENNRATFLLGNGEWESYGYASYAGTKKALSSLELDP